MPIFVRNIRFIQKTGKGHLLETPIESQNLSQFEGDIQQFLRKQGLMAETDVGNRSLTIRNIKVVKTGKRAPNWVYGRLRQMIATGLENRNMKGSVTGGSK